MKKFLITLSFLYLYNSSNYAAQAGSAKEKLINQIFGPLTVQSFNTTNLNQKKGYKKIVGNKIIPQNVNQDRILVEQIDKNFILVAVFDGHGQHHDYRTSQPLNPELIQSNPYIKDSMMLSESGRSIYYLDGGGYIADTAKDKIPKAIKNEWNNSELDLQEIIIKAFKEVQQDIINRYIDLKSNQELTEAETIEYELLKNGGTTATVALIDLDTKQVTIAVAGDSPAFIINQPNLQKAVKKPESLLERAWSYVAKSMEPLVTIMDPEQFNSNSIAIAKTADHDLKNPKEQERLSSQNGSNLGIAKKVYLMNLAADDKNYGVQTTRSLGDIPVHINKNDKPSKLGIATPEIYQFTLTPEIGLLIASDGLIAEEKLKLYLGITESEFIRIMSQDKKLSDNFITLIDTLNQYPQDDVSAIFVTVNPDLAVQVLEKAANKQNCQIAPEDDVD